MVGVLREVVVLLAVVAALNAEYHDENVSFDEDIPRNLQGVAKQDELIGDAAADSDREYIEDVDKADSRTCTQASS